MIEERFLWSAMCSANTTKATGTYATAMFPTYAQLSSLKPSNALRKENFGIHSILAKALKLMITRSALPVALPIRVKIVATR